MPGVFAPFLAVFVEGEGHLKSVVADGEPFLFLGFGEGEEVLEEDEELEEDLAAELRVGDLYEALASLHLMKERTYLELEKLWLREKLGKEVGLFVLRLVVLVPFALRPCGGSRRRGLAAAAIVLTTHKNTFAFGRFGNSRQRARNSGLERGEGIGVGELCRVRERRLDRPELVVEG